MNVSDSDFQREGLHAPSFYVEQYTHTTRYSERKRERVKGKRRRRTIFWRHYIAVVQGEWSIRRSINLEESKRENDGFVRLTVKC